MMLDVTIPTPSIGEFSLWSYCFGFTLGIVVNFFSGVLAEWWRGR